MTRLWQLLVLLVLATFATPSLAGPAIDPRAMSGIPRADPQLSAGTITVRVLGGGFDAPAVGTEVTLDLTGADGSTASRTATTDGSGRATFDGLSAFVGGKAIAKAAHAGESLSSQPIELMADAGSRVMLVTGASPAGAGGGPPAHGEPGGPEVPLPGTAFPLEGTPVGELVVGTFDLDARKPLSGIEVTLEIAKPDGTNETRTAVTDERGKVDFHELGAPKTPAGTKLTVSAVVVAGSPAQRSASFEMDTKIGMAVVLAKGELGPPPQQQPQRPAQRARMPGPRVMSNLASGHVLARIVDASDQPVSGQKVVVVKKDATNTDVEFPGTTGANGTVEIEVSIQSDAIYLVETIYSGAPWRTGFFQVDRQGGIAVDLRVFKTTSDVRRVRAVAQFDVDGLENDHARIVQLQDVMVTGDEAFWPAGGMRIFPAEGGKNLKVLPMSEEFLAHDDEKAPWASLAGPIPPGELVRLGMAYLVEHDGDAQLVWSTQLDSLETSVLVGPGMSLVADGAKVSDHESPIPDKVLYVMGPRAPGTPLEMTLSGLPTRNPVYRIIAAIVATLLVGLTMALVVLRPRADLRSRLAERRDQLLAVLEHAASGDPSRRTRVIAALDRVYRQIDALPGGASGSSPDVPSVWTTVLLLALAELQLVAATTGVLALDWPLVGWTGALAVYFAAVLFFVVAMLSRRTTRPALIVGGNLLVLQAISLLYVGTDVRQQWSLLLAALVLLVSAAVRGWPRGGGPQTKA